jgi:ParB-like chromosome segregation protein Spo0J
LAVRRYQRLPSLSPEEPQAVKEDIAAKGVLVPVVRAEDGQPLDGHHREDIAQELGHKNYPVRTVAGLSQVEKRHVVLSLNLARRSLTRAQKLEPIANELRRTLGTASHELCQVLTMRPCTAFRCLLNGSNHLHERDARPRHLCPVCLRKLC